MKKPAEQEESEGEQSIITTKEESNWQTITAGLDVVSNDYLNAATAAASTAALAAHNAQAASPTTVQRKSFSLRVELDVTLLTLHPPPPTQPRTMQYSPRRRSRSIA